MIDECRNLKIDDIEAKHRLLYELLRKFHDICEKEGLIYNLYAGSLLGAVREGGIIPWDDDVDVSMPRSDYDKFIAIVKKQNKDDVTVLAYPDENYIYPYAKFCDKNTILYEPTVDTKYYKIHLYIDIFPIDGVPEDKGKIKHIKNYVSFLAKCNFFLSNAKIGISSCWWKKPYFILRWIEKKFLKLLGVGFFLKRINRLAQTYEYETSKYVANVSTHGLNSILSKDKYCNRKLYKFGPLQCWGPIDYDKNLTDLYGDYMSRPPLEKRTLKHSYELYLKKD